jgi:hypothetical protein
MSDNVIAAALACLANDDRFADDPHIADDTVEKLLLINDTLVSVTGVSSCSAVSSAQSGGKAKMTGQKLKKNGEHDTRGIIMTPLREKAISKAREGRKQIFDKVKTIGQDKLSFEGTPKQKLLMQCIYSAHAAGEITVDKNPASIQTDHTAANEFVKQTFMVVPEHAKTFTARMFNVFGYRETQPSHYTDNAWKNMQGTLIAMGLQRTYPEKRNHGSWERAFAGEESFTCLKALF